LTAPVTALRAMPGAQRKGSGLLEEPAPCFGGSRAYRFFVFACAMSAEMAFA
jgi:hypothetical protein